MHLGRVITSPRCTVGRVNPSSSAFYQSKGRVDGSLDEPMHRKPSQTTTNHHKPPQTTARIWDDDYSCAGKKKNSLSKVWLLQSSQALSVERDAFANTHRPKSCIFPMFRWWFAAASLVGKPPQITTEKHAVLVLCDVQGFRAIYID